MVKSSSSAENVNCCLHELDQVRHGDDKVKESDLYHADFGTVRGILFACDDRVKASGSKGDKDDLHV